MMHTLTTHTKKSISVDKFTLHIIILLLYSIKCINDHTVFVVMLFLMNVSLFQDRAI